MLFFFFFPFFFKFLTCSQRLSAVLAIVIGLVYGQGLCIGEENQNCGASIVTPGQTTITCSGCLPTGGTCDPSSYQTSVSNSDCQGYCGTKWHATNDCSKYNISVKCNIAGCNCDNCAWQANNFLIQVSNGFYHCPYVCNCNCASGPIQNKGQQVVLTGSLYVNSTITGRRNHLSAKFCQAGQVSWDFVANIDDAMDGNRDGFITTQEFNDARDAAALLVTTPFGCVTKEGVEAIFPNIKPCSLRKTTKRRHAH